MASQLRREYGPPSLDFVRIPYPFKPLIHVFALHTEFLAAYLMSDNEFTFPAFSTVMSKSQKVKCIGPSLLSISVLSLIFTKANHPCLFRMQLKSKFLEPVSKRSLYVSGIIQMMYQA